MTYYLTTIPYREKPVLDIWTDSEYHDRKKHITCLNNPGDYWSTTRPGGHWTLKTDVISSFIVMQSEDLNEILGQAALSIL